MQFSYRVSVVKTVMTVTRVLRAGESDSRWFETPDADGPYLESCTSLQPHNYIITIICGFCYFQLLKTHDAVHQIQCDVINEREYDVETPKHCLSM